MKKKQLTLEDIVAQRQHNADIIKGVQQRQRELATETVDYLISHNLHQLLEVDWTRLNRSTRHATIR